MDGGGRGRMIDQSEGGGREKRVRWLAVAVSPADENPDLYPLPAQGHGCNTAAQQSLGGKHAHTHTRTQACAEGPTLNEVWLCR